MNRVMLEIASLLGANPHMASDIVLDMLANPSLPLVKAVFVRTGSQYGPYEPDVNPNSPMSYSSKSVDRLTRQEYVLIQAKGIWLFVNRANVAKYKHEQADTNPNYPALLEQDYNRLGIVEAVKFVREELGIGLLDAKNLVEEHCNPFLERIIEK